MVSSKSDTTADDKQSSTPQPIVNWHGFDDPDNPQNWVLKDKLTSTAIVSLFTFVCPFASAMLAPALPKISHDLGIESFVKEEMVLSAFVLGYLIGPLLWAPLSELYGRVPVLNAGNFIFLLFNLACGFAQTLPQMVVLRFLAGFGGIASLTSGSGLLSDCFTAEQRARVWAFYILMPLIGPSLGPVAGAFIAESTTWRWMFWSTTIFDAIVQVASIFLLRETFAPVILQQRANRKGDHASFRLHTKLPAVSAATLSSTIAAAFKRPLIMLATKPVLQVMALYGAFLYGLLYLILATYPNVWKDVYHENTGVASLNYLSLTIGFAVGEFATAIVQDIYYKFRMKQTSDGKGRPEFRLPILIPLACLLPVGLFWYGWSAQAALHWIMPNIGAALTTSSIVGSSQLVTLYVVDSFEEFTASAISGVLILRFIFGFSFPLFAPYIYASLGWGWGNSILAFIAMGLGVPSAVLLLFFGERLRVQGKAPEILTTHQNRAQESEVEKAEST